MLFWPRRVVPLCRGDSSHLHSLRGHRFGAAKISWPHSGPQDAGDGERAEDRRHFLEPMVASFHLRFAASSYVLWQWKPRIAADRPQQGAPPDAERCAEGGCHGGRRPRQTRRPVVEEASQQLFMHLLSVRRFISERRRQLAHRIRNIFLSPQTRLRSATAMIRRPAAFVWSHLRRLHGGASEAALVVPHGLQQPGPVRAAVQKFLYGALKVLENAINEPQRLGAPFRAQARRRRCVEHVSLQGGELFARNAERVPNLLSLHGRVHAIYWLKETSLPTGDMLRTEVLVSLKSYTSLPNQVQGLLLLKDGVYEVARFVTSGASFDRVLRRTFDDTVTLAGMTLLDPSALLGTLEEGSPVGRVKGPFVLRGSVYALPAPATSVVVGRVVRGRLPPGAPVAPGGAVLASFSDEDRLVDADADALYFGASVASGPLAPSYDYLAAVLDRRLGRALVACPNGLFVLRALPGGPSATVDDPRALIDNLLGKADLLLQLGSTPSVVYRLAENCLVTAGPDYDAALQSLQAGLNLPPSRRAGLLPVSSAATHQVSETVLDTMTGARVTEEAVRAQLPPDASLAAQPLVAWQQPQVTLELRVRLTALEGAPAAKHFSFKFLMAAGELGVTVTLECMDFRPLSLGDTAGGQSQRLLRVIEDEVRKVLEGGGKGATQPQATQEDANATAAAIVAALQAVAPSLDVFSQPPLPDVSLRQTRTAGERVRLPSGTFAVVPQYALVAGARLSGYLGVLGALGIGCEFFPWSLAAAGLYV